MSCDVATWSVTVTSSLLCNLKDPKGNSLCDGSNGLSTTFAATACSDTVFETVKVDACGAEDRKCATYNCGHMRVWRVNEQATGALVDPGTVDQMLTCGNTDWSL